MGLTCTASGFSETPLLTIKQSPFCEHTEVGSTESNSLTSTVKLGRCHDGETFICEASLDSFNTQDSTPEFSVLCEKIST